MILFCQFVVTILCLFLKLVLYTFALLVLQHLRKQTTEIDDIKKYAINIPKVFQKLQVKLTNSLFALVTICFSEDQEDQNGGMGGVKSFSCDSGGKPSVEVTKYPLSLSTMFLRYCNVGDSNIRDGNCRLPAILPPSTARSWP